MPNIKSKILKWFLRHSLTIVSCSLIAGLGIVFLAWSSPQTTIIGEDISTRNLTASGQTNLAGNVDAKKGLDITGGNLTVGGDKFTVDVNTGNIDTIGKLEITSNTPSLVGGVTSTDYKGRAIHISGKYAYVAGKYSDSLAIVDISDPTSPTVVGGVTSTTYMDKPQSIFVSGKYAYVPGGESDSLAVIDVSNPASPSVVGGVIDHTHLEEAFDIYVSGKYAYIAAAAYRGLTIVDISDPSFPKVVGALSPGGWPQGIYVSGDYAYVTRFGGHNLGVVDISDPTSPVLVGGISNSTYMGKGYGVYVSGKYAYVPAGDKDSLAVVDISDPTSPTFVGGVSDSTYLDIAYDAYVSGKYAYVPAGGSHFLTIIDISNPVSPTIVGAVDTNPYASYPTSVYVSGKYTYVTLGGLVGVVDITGLDAPSAHIGDISASTIEVTENMDIGNDLYVRSGLNVGPKGIYSGGPSNIYTTSSVSAFTVTQSGTGDGAIITGGNVGIGTTTPSYTLDVNGNLRVTATSSLATTTIGGGTPISKHSSKTASVSFNLDTTDACTEATTSISGAPGDVVAIGMPDTAAALSGSTWGAWISATDVVSFRYCTASATTADATLDVRFDVWQH